MDFSFLRVPSCPSMPSVPPWSATDGNKKRRWYASQKGTPIKHERETIFWMISLSHFAVTVVSADGQATVTGRLMLFFLPGGTGRSLPVLQEICSTFGSTCVCLQMQVVSCKTLQVFP